MAHEVNTRNQNLIETVINSGGVFVRWRNFTFKAAIGKNGIVDEAYKVEGDLKTPKGRYHITHGYYRQDRLKCPKSRIPFSPIESDFGWCDDSSNALYNQLIKKPFAASHEDLWREDSAYDLILVTDHNTNPVVPTKGSAIFIHIAHDDYTHSAGCLTLAKQDLLTIVENCSEELTWVV